MPFQNAKDRLLQRIEYQGVTKAGVKCQATARKQAALRRRNEGGEATRQTVKCIVQTVMCVLPAMRIMLNFAA